MMQLTGLRVQPVPTMPPGLVELMEGMTRDVLMHNPPDVYEFCAKHMEKLLIIRDGKAPKKYKLTLEQKIKLAQEKVRENAEQRRRLYDQALKKMYAEAESGTSAQEKTTGDVHTIASIDQQWKNEETGEVGSPLPLEINSLVKNVVECKFKAPIHHEKELTETLEVEIFHKPLKNLEVKDESSDHQSKDEIQSEQVIQAFNERRNSAQENEEKKEAAQSLETVSDCTTSETNNVDVLNTNDLNSKKSNLEQQFTNENNQGLHDEIRVRRSVDDEGNTDIEKDAKKTNIGISKEPDTIIESVKDSSETEFNETKTDGISEQNVTDDSFIVNTMEPMAIATDDTLDNAATFANKITESVETPENLNLELVDAKEGDGSSRELKEESNLNLDNELTLIRGDTPEDETAFENANQGDENVDDKLSDINTEQKNNGVQSIQENNINSADINNDFESGCKESHLTEQQIASQLSTGNKNVVEPTQSMGFISQEVMKGVEQKFTNNDDNRLLEVNREVSIEQEHGEGLSNKTVEIVTLSETSVTTDSSPKNHEDPSSGPSENIEKKSSYDHEANCLVTAIEIERGDLDTVQKAALDESTSEELTIVDKIWMEEHSNVKDDNDSGPIVSAKSQVKLNQETEHMNGAHLSNKVLENGSETPELDILIPDPFKETSHENENSENKNDNVAVVQDDTSTASEPAKTETSSMEEPSSLEENILEEGIDNIVEGEVTNSSPESAKDRENQNTMDLETAAITIQKVFRTFLFKRSTFDHTGIEGANSVDEDSEKVEVEFEVASTPINKERRTLGISRMDTVLQTVNEEKSLSLSTDDSSLSSAATIIQAQIRGFLVRNRLSSNRTNSASLGKSEGPSTSFENDNKQKINKTILNIHIVPEGENFLSRDESFLTSMELSLDGSPPSSSNLHPLGYDKSEPRKQLKREDAIQSISPPSNNSGKLSEDVDSVKDISDEQQKNIDNVTNDSTQDAYTDSRDNSPTKSTTIETVVEAYKISNESNSRELEKDYAEAQERRKRSLEKAHSDECDVVCEDKGSIDSDNTLGLIHSGEFHDIVLPTKVSRADTTVVRGCDVGLPIALAPVGVGDKRGAE